MTAPETKWHKEGKALVIASASALGLDCKEEVQGGKKPNGWTADTLFQVDARTVVVELQRSYQHVRDYVRRQERYKLSGIECYWLTRPENFIAISRSTSRLRIQREWGGKFPSDRTTFAPLIPEFPVAMLTLDTAAQIQCGGLIGYSLVQWLQGIIEKRYLYDDGAWIIR